MMYMSNEMMKHRKGISQRSHAKEKKKKRKLDTLP